MLNSTDSIRKVSEYIINGRIDLPEEPAVYAFWWTGSKAELLSSERNLILSGPNQQDVEVIWEDWWPPELVYPCLYVGKSTNVKKRFSMHIRNGSKKRLHNINKNGRKIKPLTTTCQLRYGIEHIFRNEKDPLKIIYNKVGFSFKTDFLDNPVVERFYEEDLLIGKWRPWFNIDLER